MTTKKLKSSAKGVAELKNPQQRQKVITPPHQTP
jgi:hypothetical protein